MPRPPPTPEPSRCQSLHQSRRRGRSRLWSWSQHLSTSTRADSAQRPRSVYDREYPESAEWVKLVPMFLLNRVYRSFNLYRSARRAVAAFIYFHVITSSAYRPIPGGGRKAAANAAIDRGETKSKSQRIDNHHIAPLSTTKHNV